MQRHVVCYRIPAFQVALVRLEDRTLRNKPIAITPSVTPHARLLDISQEARQEGVRAGMQVGHAQRLCPALTLVPPNPQAVREATRAIDHVVARFAPVWESAKPGHVFLDLTGTTRVFGRACDTAATLEKELAERFNLVGVAGVAGNKLVSEVASTIVAPWQLYDVRPGAEQMFFSPLPVDALPWRVTQRTHISSLLADLHITTLGQLAACDLADLEAVLGPVAGHVSAWAKGIDDTPVRPPAKRPCVEATATLEEDAVDVDRLRGRLHGVLETLCGELRAHRRVCRRLTLRFRYRDDREIAGTRHVRPGSCWEGELTPALHRLLHRAVRRRVRIRSFTLTLGDLQPASHQLSFVETCPAFMPSPAAPAHRLARSRRLSVAIDTIRAKFGHHAIRWAHP